jgi:hypothetical protein
MMNGDINALRIDVDGVLKNLLPANLLTALLAVDGAGSGLDADKLDGVELSSIYAKYDNVTNLGTTGTDLNTLNIKGIYSQNANVNCTAALHYPDTLAGAGILEVIPIVDQFPIQKYTTYLGRSYVRFYQNWAPVGWSAWKQTDTVPVTYAWTDASGYISLGNGLKMAWGNVLITPVANTPTAVTIGFPIAFSYAPIVMVTMETTAPGTLVTGIACANRTTSQFQIYITRTNTTATGARWFAIGG